MYVISIDPATRTGYAVWSSKGKLLKYGDVAYGPDISKMSYMTRVRTIVHENTFYGNRNVAFTIGRTVGAISATAGFPSDIVTVTANAWRHHVWQGKAPKSRKLLKQGAILKCKELLDIDVESDDAADAILIGYWYFTGGNSK